MEKHKVSLLHGYRITSGSYLYWEGGRMKKSLISRSQYFLFLSFTLQYSFVSFADWSSATIKTKKKILRFEFSNQKKSFESKEKRKVNWGKIIEILGFALAACWYIRNARFFSTFPFGEIGLTLFSMPFATFSYVTACPWMCRNRIWSSLVARWKGDNKVEPMRKVKAIFQVYCQTSWKTTSTFKIRFSKIFLYHCEDLSEKSSKMYRLLSWESISPRK